MRGWAGLGLISLALLMAMPTRAQLGGGIALAYVRDGVVTLADADGNALVATGPNIPPRQSARLFWSPDGEALYTATREGLFIAGGEGGAAVRLPGTYGLTVTLARHEGVLYNLDTDSPQALDGGLTAYPLRETNVAAMSGGRGRLLTYIGAYQAASDLPLTHAAALYARDNGLWEGGRPALYPTYGSALFFTCCFPDVGLGVADVATGAVSLYDAEFSTQGAALNSTFSRLAGMTPAGLLRVYDLISAGWRDYDLSGLGQLERSAWSHDERFIYLATRQAPRIPLELRPEISTPVDTRSATLVLWAFDLVTNNLREIATFEDVYGASSMAATENYLFVVVVERNQALIDALNSGAVPPDLPLTDPALAAFQPKAILWRLSFDGGEKVAIGDNIWGVVARPR